MIAPKYAAFADTYNKATFVKVDVDELGEVAANAKIRAMPTFQIFVDGKMVAEVIGADVHKLEEEIKKYAL
jgi:thioredoxin 1